MRSCKNVDTTYKLIMEIFSSKFFITINKSYIVKILGYRLIKAIQRKKLPIYKIDSFFMFEVLQSKINYGARYCSRTGWSLSKSSGLLIKSSQPASIALL